MTRTKTTHAELHDMYSDHPDPEDESTSEGMTSEDVGCPDCPYFGPMRYVTDHVSHVTAFVCVRCGRIGEPDDFEIPDHDN